MKNWNSVPIDYMTIAFAINMYEQHGVSMTIDADKKIVTPVEEE